MSINHNVVLWVTVRVSFGLRARVKVMVLGRVRVIIESSYDLITSRHNPPLCFELGRSSKSAVTRLTALGDFLVFRLISK